MIQRFRLSASLAVLVPALVCLVAAPTTRATADDEYYQRDDYENDAPDDVGPTDDAPEYVDTAPDPSRYGEALAPYGRWLDHPTYGRVWQPGVPSEWRPFTEGHWAWTSEGWTWVSSEPWGWTFHYGRWVQDPAIGWMWIPGDDWSPAWVDWYEEDGYVGWAPLGVAAAPAVGFSAFVFVPFDHFFSHRVHHFFVPHGRLPFRHLGNHGHWRAPDRHEIEEHTRTRVPTMRLRHGDDRPRRDVPVGPRGVPSGDAVGRRGGGRAPSDAVAPRGGGAPRGPGGAPRGDSGHSGGGSRGGDAGSVTVGPRGGVSGPSPGMGGPRSGVGGPAGGGAIGPRGAGGSGGGGGGGGHR